MTAVKIRYERLSAGAKGAASFIGMVHMDDGTKMPVEGYSGSEDLSKLPFVIDPLDPKTQGAPPEVAFPKIKP